MTDRPLGLQAFVHTEEPRQERFNRPTNTDRPVHKPDGGLWTSTLRDDGSCAWLDWCRGADWGPEEDAHLYALEPAADISVLEIDSAEDLTRALEKWERDNYPISIYRLLDFEALAEEYDAIHLTERGVWQTRFSIPGFYGWDCESTLWLRWAFRSAENCGPVELAD